MAINYASNFAPMTEEAFSLGSVTQVFSGKYEWAGAKTVTVFTNDTVTPGDYSRTGGHGTPTVIGNSKQDMTVTADKGFSALIDKLDMESTNGTMQAAAWLGQETREQIIPLVDSYRFNKLYTLCPTGQISATGAVTSANAYTSFLTGNETLDEAKVPKAGRVVFATPAYINLLKLDANYVKATELAQSQIVFNGQVGAIDGVPVISVPSSILNATDNHIDFIIVHTSAVAAPMKLEDVQIYESVPGWSGSQIDGRYVFDLFLVTQKNAGIYVKRHA